MASPEDHDDALTGCLLDGSKVNWAECDDAQVWHAAQDGVPEAQDELDAREARRPRR